MKKMKFKYNIRKILNFSFLVLLFFIFSIGNVKALDIDRFRQCTLSGIYSYSSLTFGDANVHLYKIADISDESKYIFLDTYSSFDEDIYHYSASKINDYTKRISEYIKNNDIQHNYVTKTKNDGKFQFSGLTTGLYLIIVDSVEDGNYKYTASPMLVCLPNYNQIDKLYMYDVTVFTKTGAVMTGGEGSFMEPDNSDNNTDGNQCSSILCGGYLLLLLLLLVCYIYYKIRKDVKENEKKYEENI